MSGIRPGRKKTADDRQGPIYCPAGRALFSDRLLELRVYLSFGTSALLEHSLAAGMRILAPGSRTTPKKLYPHLRLPEPENFRARPVIKGVVS
jgi:hypothetical protein